MKREIRITKKERGRRAPRFVSVRMREDTLKKLDELAEQTNRFPKRADQPAAGGSACRRYQWWRKTDGFSRTQQRT